MRYRLVLHRRDLNGSNHTSHQNRVRRHNERQRNPNKREARHTKPCATAALTANCDGHYQSHRLEQTTQIPNI